MRERQVMKKENSGKSVIELLLVILILGVFTAIMLPNIFSANAKSKQAKFFAEKQIINAQLELFYLKNGHYPVKEAPLSNWTDKVTLYFENGLPEVDPYGQVWQVSETGRVLNQAPN